MLKKITLVVLVFSLLAACNQATQKESSTAEAPAAQVASFGESISADNALSYGDLAMKMQTADSDSLAVKVKATVNEVCQAKGCWMTLSSPESTAEEMMVKFKDYGFFVPKDIAGREVIIEGYAFREVTPVDELRHYAEDAGQSKEEVAKITEPKEEYKFLASGVLLLPKEK